MPNLKSNLYNKNVQLATKIYLVHHENLLKHHTIHFDFINLLRSMNPLGQLKHRVVTLILTKMDELVEVCGYRS